jgi:EAL domain-containing protein (putative c-di-GMP-specific phosphodiesterase class I)
MGLRVVAEGLETSEAYAILKGFGCDMAQGYFISVPVPSPQLLAWMDQSQWGARPSGSWQRSEHEP